MRPEETGGSPGGAHVRWWGGLGQIEGLLLEYKADLSLYGHVHNAQLFCAMYNGSACINGAPGAYTAPVHAVIGNAGQELSPFPPLDNRTLFSYEGWGFNMLDVNKTHLTLSFYADNGLDLLFNTTIFRTYPRA